MKLNWIKTLLVFLILLLFSPGLFATDREISVCFTPGENCTESIVKELQNAKKTVLVQAYAFTSAPIARALVNAFKRKVDVEIILDKKENTEQYSLEPFILHAGIPICLDAQHAIAHNKVMIIDQNVVITGSFNFTKSAQQNNAENLLIIHSPTLASAYTKNWQIHKDHSDSF